MIDSWVPTASTTEWAPSPSVSSLILAEEEEGSAIPLGQWFRGPLKGLAADVLGGRAFAERGLVRQKAAQRYLQRHRRGRGRLRRAAVADRVAGAVGTALSRRKAGDGEGVDVPEGDCCSPSSVYVVNQVHFKLETGIPGLAP